MQQPSCFLDIDVLYTIPIGEKKYEIIISITLHCWKSI